MAHPSYIHHKLVPLAQTLDHIGDRTHSLLKFHTVLTLVQALLGVYPLVLAFQRIMAHRLLEFHTYFTVQNVLFFVPLHCQNRIYGIIANAQDQIHLLFKERSMNLPFRSLYFHKDLRIHIDHS